MTKTSSGPLLSWTFETDTHAMSIDSISLHNRIPLFLQVVLVCYCTFINFLSTFGSKDPKG